LTNETEELILSPYPSSGCPGAEKERNMKYVKMLGLAGVAVMAMAVVAGSASATTLEIGGVKKNESVTLTASLKSGTSLAFKNTGGLFVNTCTTSHLHGATASPFTGESVTGPLSSLTLENCTRPMVVHAPGSLRIEYIAGTTNGTVFSENTEVTVNVGGISFPCKTGTGTPIGILTGTASGHAILDINVALDCLIWLKLEATYVITGPTGLGVSQ
jgi:hypothetical protein